LSEPKRTELSVQQKRAILVAVVLPEDSHPGEDVFDELYGLVKTAGVQVVGTLVQNRQKPDTATYLGKGKVEELKALKEELNAELLVFDKSLTPAQGRNLEEETGALIVDRSEIILDIFHTHARTYEAQLQVELAQLLYFRPRLKRMWSHLSREGGFGNRGAGEQQLEIDRRLIDTRVSELRRKLAVVERQRERMVSQRKNQFTVSLVGYTNAGKSTLMNALTGADVYVADKLFATLDTRTRAWTIPHWGNVLLSDTVGFIRDLPHNLVASFKSTLEEGRHADVLLHVVDASHPAAERQIATVNEVLEEIGVDGSNAILVLNKIDAVEDRSLLDVLRRHHPDAISISAAQGVGLDRLAAVVASRLGDGYLEAEIETNVGNGRLFAYLAEHAEVTRTEYTDSRVRFNCRIPKRFASGLAGDDTHIVTFEGTDGPNGLAHSA
jgi:GTP-binding protein HflX